MLEKERQKERERELLSTSVFSSGQLPQAQSHSKTERDRQKRETDRQNLRKIKTSKLKQHSETLDP